MGASESTASPEILPNQPSETFSEKPLETPPAQPKETAESKKKRKALEFKSILEEELLESIYPPPDAQVIKTGCKKSVKSVHHNAQRILIDAEPIGNKESMVNDFDGRKQVHATNKWPNSVHGLVLCQFEGGKKRGWGTGTLFGPNFVLTAAHNLYCKKTKTYIEAKDVQFFPGMNGQLSPFGSVGVSSRACSENYPKTGLEDYAILILKKPIGEETGYFGLSCLESEEIQKKTINITGYPSDKVASKKETYEMWEMGGKVCHVDQDRGLLKHKIDTERGQSGSGIWYQEGEDYYVCGVHIEGGSPWNTGAILTKNIYRKIYPHLQQAKYKELRFRIGESKKLDLQKRKIDANRLSAVLDYPLEDLKFLDLSENKIWKGGAAKILAQNTSLISLSKLRLRWNNIGPEGAKALAQNGSWINLLKLDLSFNNIGSEGTKALAQNISWTKLSSLYLSDNNIDAEGVKALSQNTSWVNLSLLYLSDNQIDAEGARALVKNSAWTKLSDLHLSGNNIDSEEAKTLSEKNWWGQSKPKIWL